VLKWINWKFIPDKGRGILIDQLCAY